MKAYDVAVDQQLSGAEISMDVVSNVQLGGAVVCRLDHVVHGKRLELHRKYSTRLEYEGVATSLSDVFTEERCKVDVDSGIGSFVGHERCDGRSLRRDGRRRDLFEIIQRCFREFWKTQGLRVRVLVLRGTENVRMPQETEEPRHGTVEGVRGCSTTTEGAAQVQMSRVRQVWSGCEIQRSECVRSKQEKLGRDEMNALEIGSVLLLERNHEIQVGIDSCAAVTVFVHFRCFVTKSCKSCTDLSARKVKGKLRGVSFWYANPRMAETCEVLMAVSESDMSHDVFFPCNDEACYDEGTQACAYHEGCGTKLELEQIEDANSEYMRCLKCARS